MTQNWTGSSLQTEFAEILSNTSTEFKARTLKWINDIQNDIYASYNWPFCIHKGQKVLTASTEQQSLSLGTPSAPTLAALAGGSLATSSTKVRVTFYEGVSGRESIAGEESSAITPSGGNLSITVSAIPVSSDTLVTARKIYVSVAGAAYFYYSTISDNTSTTTTITAPTSSTIEPPEEDQFELLISDPWIESTGTRLKHMKRDQQISVWPTQNSSGTPNYYDVLNYSNLLLYPQPSSALTISFYYKKKPARIFADTTRKIELPERFKELLEAGVEWKGYRYKNKDNRSENRDFYYSLKDKMINEFGRARSGPSYISDVYGDSDGFLTF